MSRNHQNSRHQICQQQDILPVKNTNMDSELPCESSIERQFGTIPTLCHSDRDNLWYCSLYENNPSISICLDINGDILSINQFGASRLGCLQEDLIGKSIFKLFAISEQGKIASLIAKILQKSYKSQNRIWEFRLDCPTSHIGWVKINASCIDIPENRSIILMVMEDITSYKQVENKQIEDNLTQTKQLFFAIEHSVPAMIWMSSDRTHYTFINRKLADFIGISESNNCIISSSFRENNIIEILDFIHPEDKRLYCKIFNDALLKQHKFCCEYRLKTRDGEYRWILDTGIPQIDCEGKFTGYIGSWVDITDLNSSRTVLEESHNNLSANLQEKKDFNRLKDEFLSTVSHELRAPLTNMKMAIQMLGISLNQQENLFRDITVEQVKVRKIARYFQILNNECEREINLINNFLDIQRLDSSIETFVLETIVIDKWLTGVVELFKHNARSRSISYRRIPSLDNHPKGFDIKHRDCNQQKLHLDISPHLPHIICDPFSLERIIIELLTNACKFSPLGGEITVKAISQYKAIEIQVINTGVEISKAELPKIFDKFYRIPSNDPWKQGGTGLGLALVKKLTNYLGGTVAVSSKLNTTCFKICIPHNRYCQISNIRT